MAIDIGRIAYQEYIDSLQNDSKPWESIGKKEQDAWRSAAVAVLKYIDSERKILDEED